MNDTVTESRIYTAADIAGSAATIVAGARESTHGEKVANHQKIADVWNGILRAAGKAPSAALDAHDVANLMEGLKIARRYLGSFNLDDYIDGAGYAACAGEIRSKQEAGLASKSPLTLKFIVQPSPSKSEMKWAAVEGDPVQSIKSDLASNLLADLRKQEASARAHKGWETRRAKAKAAKRKVRR